MKERDSVKKSLTDFGNETTIHGLQFVVNKENIVYRLVWLGICVSFMVVFVIQGNIIVKDFLEWPYATKIDIVGRPSLPFPAVTVCNANMMRRSQLADTRFAGLVDLDGGVSGSDYDYSWWFSSGFLNGFASSSYGSSTNQYQYSSSSFGGPSSLGGSSSSANPSSSSSSFGGSSSSENPSSSSGRSSSSLNPSSSVSSNAETSSSNDNPSSSFGGSSSASSGSSNDPSSSSSSYNPSSSSSSNDWHSSSSSTSYSESSSLDWRFSEWSWYNPSFFESFDFVDYWDGVENGNDWQGFYEASRADDYSDFLDTVKPTRDELKQYGHQLEDFVLQCTFDRRQCDISRDFQVWQNRYYGNCFTFNGFSPNNTEKRNIQTGKTGGLNGLHLTLFVEQPEYLGILSPHTGAKVSIHHPNEHPFPEDTALALPTGQETSVGIRQEFIKRLGGYYTNCTLDGKNTNFSSSSNFVYSTQACKKNCYQLHLRDLCGCVDDQFFDDFPIKCDVINQTHQICRRFVEELHLDEKLPCSCPPPCEEFKYVRTPSSSIWPSERYEEHLFRRLNESGANVNILRILESNELSRKNLIRLKIFYEDLNYEFVEMVPVYTIPSLLGSVGGLMGLYIGMSFISVFEVLFLVLRIIKVVFMRIFVRNSVSPHTVKSL